MREHRKDGAPVALEISLTPFAALPQSIPSLRRDRYRLRENRRFETGGGRLSPICLTRGFRLKMRVAIAPEARSATPMAAMLEISRYLTKVREWKRTNSSKFAGSIAW